MWEIIQRVWKIGKGSIIFGQDLKIPIIVCSLQYVLFDKHCKDKIHSKKIFSLQNSIGPSMCFFLDYQLKLIYSEKASKFGKISTVDLTGTT